MSDAILIYSTWPDLESARQTSALLLKKKLIACANIMPSAESHYVWNEEIHVGTEIIVIMKSLKEVYDLIVSIITANHPYDVPAILALNIDTMSSSFKDFLDNSIDKVFLSDTI